METKRNAHKTKPHGAKLKPGVLSCVRANPGSSPRCSWARRKACLLVGLCTRPGGTQQCGLLWNHFERPEYRLSLASSCSSPDNLMDDPSIPSWVIFLFPNKQTGLAGIHSTVGEAVPLPETPGHTRSCCRPTWLAPVRAAFLSAGSPPLCSSERSASLPEKGPPKGCWRGRLSSGVWRSVSLCSVLRHLTTSDGLKQLFLEMAGPPGHLSPASLSAFLSRAPFPSRHGCRLPWLLKASLSSEMTLSDRPSHGWEKLSRRTPGGGTYVPLSPLTWREAWAPGAGEWALCGGGRASGETAECGVDRSDQPEWGRLRGSEELGLANKARGSLL